MLHTPVLVDRVIWYVKGRVWVDATIGTGGHTEAILTRYKEVFIYGVDIDGETLDVARKRLRKFKGRFKLIQGNFRNLNKLIPGYFDGVLFDIGVSSFQLDDVKRGFSFRFDGPLDMRMDRNSGVALYRRFKYLRKMEIEEIIRNYGEERYARVIAGRLYDLKDKIRTTGEFRSLIGRNPKTLSRVFQAFRIFMNEELENLKGGVQSAVSKLKEGGRVTVISYHSLEDRIVKQFFKDNDNLRILTKKPITPSDEEIGLNSRARSAKMRVAEKREE